MTREGPVEKTDLSLKKTWDDRKRTVIGQPPRRWRATAGGGYLTQDEDAQCAAVHGERPVDSNTGDARSATVCHEVQIGETQEVRLLLRKGFGEEGWLCPTPAPHDGEIGWRKGEVTEMRGVFAGCCRPRGPRQPPDAHRGGGDDHRRRARWRNGKRGAQAQVRAM